MSAPVLTLPLSVGCYDGTTIMDANGKQVAGSEDITLAASIVAAVNESASLRAECEAVRADRDSLWTTVNRVKAERDAALAEAARNREAMDACVAYSQHWQCFEACRSIGRQEFERRSMEVHP